MIISLEEAIRFNNKHRFGSKSEKLKSKNTDDHIKNKEDLDGTQDSMGGMLLQRKTTT